MENLFKLSLIFAFMLLGGCFKTELNAPVGHEVRILSREEPAKFKKEYKNWYLFYGLIPVWTTQPEEIIKEQDLVEVRAQTKDTVADAVITALSSFIPILVFTQHVIVEGNRASDMQVRPLSANSNSTSDNSMANNQSIHGLQSE